MQILETENFTENTLNEIINSCLEESINIEFKSAQALSKDNSVKKRFQKTFQRLQIQTVGLFLWYKRRKSHCDLSFIY